MRIHSFIDPDAIRQESATLAEETSHHLARVLRVAPGQELSLFDGEGMRAEAVVDSVNKNEVTVRIRSRESVPPPPVSITLIQALPKPDRFETVLQKATELGVRRICPVITRHTVNRPGNVKKTMTRWQAIVRHAAQQSGSAWLPILDEPRPFDALLDRLPPFDLSLVGSLQPGAKPLYTCLREQREKNPRTVALWIGPEGDFTAEEVDAAIEHGALPVTFGTQILRTETATLFGLSVLVYELFSPQ